MLKKDVLKIAKERVAEYHIDITKFKLSDSYVTVDEWNKNMKDYYFTFESKTCKDIRVSVWIEYLDKDMEGYYKVELL